MNNFFMLVFLELVVRVVCKIKGEVQMVLISVQGEIGPPQTKDDQ